MIVRSFALFVWLSLVSSLTLLGCESTPAPQLITVTDFAPREAEVGDRLEVRGAGFPKGKIASLSFRGALNRPGEEPTHTEVDVQGTVTSGQQIELPFTDDLQALFCGRGERAMHTTFAGDIEVAFPAVAQGAPPVTAMLRGVTIDFRPPAARRALVEARAAEGARALAYLGMTVAPEMPASGGLMVQAITPGSRSDRAGVVPGDLITSFDRVRIISLADAVPSGVHGSVALGIRRGETATEMTKDVAIDGFSFAAPGDLLGAALILGILAALCLLFFAPGAGVLAFLERRVAKAKSLRTMATRDFFQGPKDAPFRVAPYAVFLAVSAVFMVLPFGRYLVVADLDIGLLFIVAITSLVTVGLLTGGAGSTRAHQGRYSFVRALRAALQIASCQLPAAIAIACIVLMTGSLRMEEVIRAQGGLPWDWYMFRTPITLGLFFLFLSAVVADSSRAPIDFPEADGEPAEKRGNGRGGLRAVLFFVAEWANVFVMCGLGATLFLGGWQLPGVSPGDQESRLDLELLGCVVFLLKAWSLVVVVVAIRRSLPRVRVDQMSRLAWKWLVPLSLVALALTVAWIVWSPGQTAQRALGIGVFAVFCVGILRFFQRVRYTLRDDQADPRLNAFL